MVIDTERLLGCNLYCSFDVTVVKRVICGVKQRQWRTELKDLVVEVAVGSSNLNEWKLPKVSSNVDASNTIQVSYKHLPSLITHIRSIAILSSNYLLSLPK